MPDPNPTDDKSIDDDPTNTDAGAPPGSESQSDSEATSSRRTYLKATGLLAALGVGGLASTDTAAAQTSHDHLGESWAGTPGSNLGLEAHEQSTSGFSYGLRGISDSPKGRGVFGLATAESGRNYGLWGKTESTEGTGLSGTAAAATGPTQGVFAVSKSDQGRGVFGRATSSSGDTIGVRGQSLSDTGTGVQGEGDTGVSGVGNNIGVKAVNSGEGPALYSDGDATVTGDLNVTGTKNFVQTVTTPFGGKEITYTAVEAGKARTEVSGVGKLHNGEQVIDLPEHFGLVTSDNEPLVVQLTPYATEQVQLQVVDRSTDDVGVRDVGDGPDNYSFAYTIKGVREGFEEQNIVRNLEQG